MALRLQFNRLTPGNLGYMVIIIIPYIYCSLFCKAMDEVYMAMVFTAFLMPSHGLMVNEIREGVVRKQQRPIRRYRP